MGGGWWRGRRGVVGWRVVVASGVRSIGGVVGGGGVQGGVRQAGGGVLGGVRPLGEPPGSSDGAR